MSNKYHFSQILKIKSPKHSKFDFIDINLKNDQKLFIDPGLIMLHKKNEWYKKANIHIDSFFDAFYKAYRENNQQKKRELLSHATELNYTKLGYGNGINGHGNTVDGLIETFKPLEQLINKVQSITNVIDLPVMISGFNEDGLSDMITNILHQQLNDFTLEILTKYKVIPNAKDKFHTWDISTSSWIEVEQPCYEYEGKKVLLTPKRIVRKKYLFSADNFLNRVILERKKQETAYEVEVYNKKTKNTTKKIKYKTTKKKLKREIEKFQKNWRYAYVQKHAASDPSLLNEYHQNLSTFYENKGLSDEELDKFIY